MNLGILAITVLLVAAAVCFSITRASRIPVIPLLLLAGIRLRELLEFSGQDFSVEMVAGIVQLGLAFLVFSAGVDLSPHRIAGRARPVLRIALFQFFAIGITGAALAFGLDALNLGIEYGWRQALYMGLAISASSTLVVVRHLQQRQQMFEPFGRIVTGVLLIQDVLILLFLVGLTAMGTWTSLGTGFGYTLLLAMVAYGFHRYLIPWMATKGNLDQESLLLFALALLFAFIGAAAWLDLPFLVGAFLAGFALSAFPMNGLVRGMLHSISSFFLALFFLCIGMLVTLPSPTILLHALLFSIVLIGVTIVLVTWICERTGLPLRASLETGLLLSQTSEFSLLIALIGVSRGDLSPELFSLITVITVGTMTLTPYLARDHVAFWLMRFLPRYRKGAIDLEHLKNHVIVLGYGRAGAQMVKLLQESGVELVVVDDDAGVIRKMKQEGIPCLQGDGSDPRILEQVQARKARFILCTMRRPERANRVMEYLKGTPTKVLVRTFEPDHAKFIESHGGIPVVTSEASAEKLMDWFETNYGKRGDSNQEGHGLLGT